MALSLFSVNEGYLDDVAVGKVVVFESAMQAYVKSNHGAVMEDIEKDHRYSDEIVERMAAAVDDFKKNGSW